MGHVIEGEERWPEWFAREVLSGPLHLDPTVWRKPRPLSTAEMCRHTEALAKSFDPYDWTRRLHG